ncbi:MAG: glycerol-3-phosphate 1-O-acyltransferase PlsY [Dehalobacterium sp.]
MESIMCLILAYFLGAIPWAYIVTKAVKGIDIRQVGSGNVGFTNALRFMGKGPAFLVLAGDIGKGLVAVLLAKYWATPLIAALAGLLVVLGHNNSIFLDFKGGKGAAAGFGVMLALLPLEALIAVVVWLVVIFLTRYVSLGTIIGALTVPISTFIFDQELPYILFSILGAAFVIFKHYSNIQRLLAGTERKIGK